MTKPPEVSMDDGLTKPRGYQVTRPCAFLLACLFLIVIGSALLLMYLLAPCPCARSAGLSYSRLSRKSNLYVRLPTSVVPHAYNLKLIPFLRPGNFTFNGSVDITVNVTQSTYNITLHSADLTIHSTTVRRLVEENTVMDEDSPDYQIPIRKTEFDLKREFYVIHLNRQLETGQYKVKIQFTGILNDALQGFYRSSYVGNNNVTWWIATTQFQSTDARRAFPCFDEPALKAKFTIHIGRPEHMKAISNMPKVGPSSPVDGMRDYVWDHFQESLPMSTYLVAFTVSDFDHYADGTFRVWARSQAIDQAKYALKIGPKILRYFEEYFGIRYPLPKMDMIALPDFAAGAMENWGLITYRESTMLFQEGVSFSRHKQRVGTVVAHELAHQWFGNLVTPSWWSDLWLNEGFATYIESLGVEMVEPTWRTGDQFVVHDLQNVLEQDAYKSSHPVSAPVSHPNEIDEIFDSISYGKGASIIRMMDHFLTTPVFKRGLTNYLKSRIYQSATQDDLWQALTDQAHADDALDTETTVKQIMDTWTLKTGFPVVSVKRDYDSEKAEISQKRFQYIRGRDRGYSDWWVPLSYTSQDRSDFTTTRPSHWLKAQGSITIPLQAQQYQWVIFNINQTGFYRVNYDEKNWQMIINQLKDADRFQRIGELNRAQLIDDSLQLARAGLLNYSIALNLTTYLAEETAYLPWEAAFPGLGFLNTMVKKMPIYDKFKNYFLHLIHKLYQETGFIDKHTDEQLLIYKRVEVLRWACALGHEDCVKNAVLQFQHWRSSPNPDKNNPVSANLKSTIYCTALREGGQAEWDFAWERYLNANVGSEKGLILQALGCSRETWILTRYLYRAITEGSGIRKQDTATVFSTVSSNIIGRPLAFDFVTDNWQKIKEFLGPTVFTLSNIIRFTTNDMITEKELRQLKEFAISKGEEELASATKAVDQSIEIVEANVHWMKNYYKDVERWLEKVKF